MAKKSEVKNIDITKSGPMTYKDLQNANQEPYSNLSPEFQTFSMNVGANTAPTSLYDARAHAEQMITSPLGSSNTPWGESVFDEATATEAQFQELGDIRAENQPWYSQIGNGLAKGAILAGTTFLDGTVGLVLGAGTAIKDWRWSGLWDNDFSKAMQSVNEWSEQALPNYYTEAEQEQPWYENIFTANFLGDKFIKNLGFTVGAFYSGGVTAAGLKATKLPQLIGAIANSSKAPAIVTTAVGATVSAVNEGRIEALNNSKDWFELHKAQLDAKYNQRIQDIVYQYQGTEIYDQMIAAETDAYNQAIGKLNEDRLKMGNADLLMNIPILTASNIIQFGKLYANGFKTARKATNIVGKAGEYTAGTTKLGSALAITRGALSEGTEEISQKAASVISGKYYATDVNNFYKSKTDPEASQETLSWVKSFAEGINETVNDGSSWEEFFIGTLTGALGMPRFRSMRSKEGGFQSPITFDGGAINEWREYNEKMARENEIANYMNNRINSPEFKNYYQGLIRHNKYQNDMNRAAEEGDEFNFKNAEHAQLISDISMFDNAGRMEDLTTLIDTAFDTSDENLASIVENTTTTLEDGSKVGPFVDKNGNPMYATPEGKQEMIDKLKQNHDEMTSAINEYLNIKDDIDIRTGQQLSDSQLEELTFIQSQINNWKSRRDDMFSQIEKPLREEFDAWDLGELLTKLARSKNSKEFVRNLTPRAITEIVEDILPESDLSEVDKANIISAMDDMIKVQEGINIFNSKLKEYLENPQKQAKDHARADEEAAKINKASEDIKKKEGIVNKSVSEINEAIDNGDFTEDDLLGMFPDGLPDSSEIEEASEAESKAKAALDIRDKTSRIKSEIDKSDLDDTTKNNAKKLIDSSKSISDSLDDLTDLSSEAFNDPSLMFDDLDPSLQGLDTESLQDELEIRLGGAKDLLSEVISIVNDNEDKLDEMPKNISEGVKESSVESTGHDSVDKNEPINKSKAVKTIKGTLADSLIQQAIDESNDSPTVKTLRDVIKDIDKLVNAGAIEKTIKKTIYNSASYKKAVEGFPGLVQSIDNYISDKLQERDYKSPEVVEERTSEYNPLMEDDILTTENTSTGLQDNDSHKPLDKVESTGGIYTSWLSPLSKYYRYSPKGDRTTFDQIAEGMNYTPEKLKRVKAIWNYLDRHNAFDYVNQGNVKVGDKIEFAISQALNEEAGELVIILRKDNHVVGVLPSSNDKEFNNYAGLSDFVELIKKEYESLGNPISFASKYTTSVNKNMVGRVPYTSNEIDNLNSIFTNQTSSGGNTNIPFELGISSGDGRNAEMIISSVRKGTSRSVKDKQRTIMSPLDAKKGQPYLLVKTSDPNRAYFPVPFSMPYYSQDTSDSALGKAIDNVLNSLVGLQAKDIMKVKREIQELLAIPELHINILKNGNLKIDAKFQGDNKQTNIYNGRIDNPNLIQDIKSKLYGTPFQVSRKYINDTYKGQDYNRMIGELAYTNIDDTHTIDDWFTINPIDKEGKEFKGKTFKSTRTNPNSAKPQIFEYNWKGIPLKVDLNTFEVRDSEGNLKEGKNADIVKALAYGFKNSKSGTYKTPFGWFNSETLEFVDEPKSENVIKRTLSIEESSELILREATGENVKIVDNNTRPFSDSIVDSFINAFNNSSIELPIDFINSQAENDRKYSIAEFLYRVAKKYGLTKSEQEKVSTIMKQYPSADFGKRFPIYDDYLDKVSKTTPSRPEANNTFATPEELEEQARKKGLISSPKRKSMWKALDISQQEAILNIKGLKQEQTMKGLELAYDVKTNKFNMSKLKGSIENYLGMKPLYRRVTESNEQVRERELKWLSRVLHNLSSEEIIKIVDGLIKIPAESGGGFAWGQFKQGIIEISNVAARGTVYHEAFHAVTHTLLNDSEYEELFKAGREKYGNLSDEAIEENLAEDFRRYMQLEEMPFVGRVVRIFRTLKHIVQNLLGKETYLNKVYYNINHAKFTNREVQETDVVRNLELTPARFQEIVDSVVNNSTHTIKGRNNEWGKFVDSWKKDGVEVKGYRGSNNKYIVTSVKNISEQSYYRRIEQYHREKLMYGNLSNEDKQYLSDRGISINEYNRMSQFEREVLFHCK